MWGGEKKFMLRFYDNIKININPFTAYYFLTSFLIIMQVQGKNMNRQPMNEVK
jgi:hypothetical protein